MSLQRTNLNITKQSLKCKNKSIETLRNKTYDFAQDSLVKDSAEYFKLDKKTSSDNSKTIDKNVNISVEQKSENENLKNMPSQPSELFCKKNVNGSSNNPIKNLVNIVKIEGTTNSEISEYSKTNCSSNICNTIDVCNNEKIHVIHSPPRPSNSLHNKSNNILKTKEDVSDSNCVKNSTDQSSVAQSNDNSEGETTDMSDMMTQLNVSLIPKTSTSHSNLENEDIFDACTQINTSLNSNPMVYSIIKEEIVIKDEFDDELNFAAEETQVNLNIQENKTINRKQKIGRANHTKPVDDISNIEAEETQPNLNIYSLFSESKIEPDTENDISDLQTQPFNHKANIAEDDDSTDIEENSKLLEGETIKDNYIKEYQGSLLNIVPLITNKGLIMKNEDDIDDNSNQSESVLTSVPVDPELLEQESLQSGILEIPESGKQNEQATEIDNENGVNPTHNVYCEASKKPHQVTLDEMDICSTVGDGTYISACGSSRKEQISSKIKLLPPQNSCNKIQQIPTSIKASELLSHSIFFNEPCGSSTPFRLEDTGGKNKKNQGRTVLKTPPRGINKRTIESPDLPCTDDILAVASEMPERQKCISPAAESLKKKEILPLALKRTPRARKLSRKMAESLKGGQEDATPSSLAKNNFTASGEVSDNSNKEKINSFETNYETKTKALKRKTSSQKIDYADTGCKDSAANTNKDILQPNNCVSLTVNVIDINKKSKFKKTDTKQNDIEKLSPVKRTKRKEIEVNNIELSSDDVQSGFKQRSSRQKKLVDQFEEKKENTGKGEKTQDKRREIENDEYPSRNRRKNESIEKLNHGLKKLSKRKPENNIMADESSKNDSLISPSPFLIDNADISSNSKESSFHKQKLQVDKLSDRSPSKRVKLNKAKPLEDTQKHEKRPLKSNLELKSSSPSKTDQPVKKNDSVADKNTRSKKNNRLERKKTETLSKIEFSGSLNSSKICCKPGTITVDVIDPNTNEHITLRKRPRNTETPDNSIAEKSKQSKNIKKNEKQKLDKEVKMKNIKFTAPNKSDVGNVEDNMEQSKCGKKDNRAKKMDKDKHEPSHIETTNRNSELPETNIRKSNRMKKDANVEIIMKENEMETTSELKSKQKLKDNLVENPKVNSRKSTRKNKEVSKVSDKTSTEDVEHSSSGRNSSRSRVKPARFRNKEDIEISDSSNSDKGPSLTKRRKGNEVSISIKPSYSVAPEGVNSNKEHTTVISPSGSEKLRSRSRSDSISSRSSLKNDTSLLQSPRRAGARGKRVLFSTGLRNEELDSQVKKLGGSVVDAPVESTLMVTDKVRRTVNFLCVLGQGKPIVSPDWITQSWRCTRFEEPMNHLLVDKEAEEKFNFSLFQTVQLAKQQPLLTGFHIHATTSVKPPPEDLKSIVECCGGEYVEKVPSKWPENSIIISHVDDKPLWKKFKVKGVTPPIVAAEMLLIGVLRHKLEVDPHRIS